MENQTNNKLGAGIITISVIYLVLYAISFLSSIISLVSFDLIKEQLSTLGMDSSVLTKSSLIVSLILCLLLAAGIIIILCKKALGVYLFFIVYLINFISGIVMNGFKLATLVGLILPCLYAFFIYKKKYIFGLGNDTNQSQTM